MASLHTQILQALLPDNRYFISKNVEIDKALFETERRSTNESYCAGLVTVLKCYLFYADISA